MAQFLKIFPQYLITYYSNLINVSPKFKTFLFWKTLCFDRNLSFTFSKISIKRGVHFFRDTHPVLYLTKLTSRKTFLLLFINQTSLINLSFKYKQITLLSIYFVWKYLLINLYCINLNKNTPVWRLYVVGNLLWNRLPKSIKDSVTMVW